VLGRQPATLLRNRVFGKQRLGASEDPVFRDLGFVRPGDTLSCMKKSLAKAVILAAVLLCQSALSQTVTLKIVNGITGKPLTNQRLVVFAGKNADDVRFQKHVYDLKTDTSGLASLTVDDSDLKRIQVWADFQHLCQATPNFRSFDLAEIASTGLSTPNDCGSITLKITPGTLTIFSRPRTKREIRDQ
jgi:hypothetical protein